jgi:hypothetical protein
VRLQAIAADGSVRISMTGEALQTGPAPDPPTILSATNQLTLEFDRTTVASWAGGAAELTLRVEGRFESGRYFSGDARFDLPAPTLLGVPSSQTLHATSAAGAVFDFGPVTAANDGWGVVSIGCDPKSYRLRSSALRPTRRAILRTPNPGEAVQGPQDRREHHGHRVTRRPWFRNGSMRR